MHFILLSKELSSVKGMGVPCQLVGLGPGSSASSAEEGAPQPHLPPTCPRLDTASHVTRCRSPARVAECTPVQGNTAAARPPLTSLLPGLSLRLCWGLTGVRRPGLRERFLDSGPAVRLIKAPEAMPGSPFVVLGPRPLLVPSALCLQGRFASPLCQVTTFSSPHCVTVLR